MSELDESGLFGHGVTAIGASGSLVDVELADGSRRTCLDFMTAYGAVNFGHMNPALSPRAVVDIVGSMYPPEAALVARWICERLDLPDHQVLFQVGGSFAVSTALAIAHLARPGRPAAVARAFHGLGVDAQALTGVQTELALQRTDWASLPTNAVVSIEPGSIPTTWDGISAFIFEPIQGANGYVPLDPAWLRAITRSANEAGVIVIADEIQAGFYRHGHLSVSRAHGIEPDVIVFSKSLTNGAYPLSAVAYRTSLVPVEGRTTRLSHTFQTGAAGYAAAWKLAAYLDVNPVQEWCIRTEKQMRATALDLEAAGAERCYVMGPSMSFSASSGKRASEFVQRCFASGLLVFTGGHDGARIRVAPPVNIEPEHLERGLEILKGEWRTMTTKVTNDGTLPAGPDRRTKESFDEFLTAFLAGESGGVTDIEVLPETDLFRAGLLDSLRMVELVVQLEEYLGVEIPLESLSVRSFRTPEAMWDRVVGPLAVEIDLR